jgi:hypothetical protein
METQTAPETIETVVADLFSAHNLAPIVATLFVQLSNEAAQAGNSRLTAWGDNGLLYTFTLSSQSVRGYGMEFGNTYQLYTRIIPQVIKNEDLSPDGLSYVLSIIACEPVRQGNTIAEAKAAFKKLEADYTAAWTEFIATGKLPNARPKETIIPAGQGRRNANVGVTSGLGGLVAPGNMAQVGALAGRGAL